MCGPQLQSATFMCTSVICSIRQLSDCLVSDGDKLLTSTGVVALIMDGAQLPESVETQCIESGQVFLERKR